jgi:cyclic beta-1,2-glucan synthetase
VSEQTRERGPALSARLRDNARVLLRGVSVGGGEQRGQRAISPAAGFVDNIHIVEEQIREIHDDLPRGFYRELPKLADSPFGGTAACLRHRVGLRRAHGQPLRSELLRAFLRAYQRVQP